MEYIYNIYIHKRADLPCIYPKKLQFAAYGQFVLVTTYLLFIFSGFIVFFFKASSKHKLVTILSSKYTIFVPR